MFDVKNEAARKAFVNLAKSAAHEAYDGRNKSELSVEFMNGKTGVEAATQILKVLQKSGLAEKLDIPVIEPLAGSEAVIGNATIKVLSGGLVSLSFKPTADMTMQQVTQKMDSAAEAQQIELMATRGIISNSRS